MRNELTEKVKKIIRERPQKKEPRHAHIPDDRRDRFQAHPEDAWITRADGTKVKLSEL